MAPPMAYMPTPEAEGADQEVLLGGSGRRRSGRAAERHGSPDGLHAHAGGRGRHRSSWAIKRGLLATLAFATVGAVVLWAGSSPRSLVETEEAGLGETVELAADIDDPCSAYPFIDLIEAQHKNLGNQGPDSGDEGIRLKAKDYTPGHDPFDLFVTVNASSNYQAGHAKYNGIHGSYGLITMKAGSEEEFTFRILDPATGKPKRLAKQEMTFFDLDEGSDGLNREYIEVSGASNMWLTKNSEIEVTDLGDGRTKFMSTTQGNGADNPKDPKALTVQQKNRAVTLEFKDFDELKVTMGATAGKHARYFMYVFRPSLICAKTVGQVDGSEDEVVEVDTSNSTTLPPTTTTAIPPTKDCLMTVPILNFCVPKAWKFW